MKRIHAIAVFLYLLTACISAPARAVAARVDLAAGWTLMSPPAQPASPRVEDFLSGLRAEVGTPAVEAIIGYENASRTWKRYPAIDGVPVLESITIGQGYWVKVDRKSWIEFEAADAPSATEATLQPDWNLIGFALQEPSAIEVTLRGIPWRELWRYEPGVGFQGVAKISVAPPRFTQFEPGRAYWVFVNSASPLSIEPELITGLPADTDLPPLLLASVESLPLFSPRTPGDINIGADVFGADDPYYDRPETQRFLAFIGANDTQAIAIRNGGRGVLAWRARIANPEAAGWLRFRGHDADGREVALEEVEGSVATGATFIEVVVDQTGLAPGVFDAEIVIETNGRTTAPFPNEPTRRIPVRMRVPDLVGDYQVRAEIERVDDHDADLPNPRFYVGIYRDGDDEASGEDRRLKAIISGGKSLLHQTTRLAGGMYRDGSAAFVLSGSTTVAPGEGNPFGEVIVREMTLIGDRRSRLDPAGRTLGRLDLMGEIHETIRFTVPRRQKGSQGAVIPDPIHLRGRFSAIRLSDAASTQDELAVDDAAGGFISDGGQPLVREFPVNDTILISDVDVVVDVVHSSPSDLRIALVSPQGREVVLRQGLSGSAAHLLYDERDSPKESLSAFNGQLSRTASQTVWRLVINDQVPGNAGTVQRLRDARLILKGTKTSTIRGRLAGVPIPPGALVSITGCGVTHTTRPESDGSYVFESLVDCPYRVSLIANGASAIPVDVPLAGADTIAADLITRTAPSYPAPVATVATSWAGAGAVLPNGAHQYVRDSATSDIGRPPSSTGAAGDEDTTEFNCQENPLTMTNRQNPLAVGRDQSVDCPVGDLDRHHRAFVAMGGPTVGRAAAGEHILQLGLRPRGPVRSENEVGGCNACQ